MHAVHMRRTSGWTSRTARSSWTSWTRWTAWSTRLRVRHLHYQRSNTCSRHICSHVFLHGL